MLNENRSKRNVLYLSNIQIIIGLFEGNVTLSSTIYMKHGGESDNDVRIVLK